MRGGHHHFEEVDMYTPPRGSATVLPGLKQCRHPMLSQAVRLPVVRSCLHLYALHELEGVQLVLKVHISHATDAGTLEVTRDACHYGWTLVVQYTSALCRQSA